MLLGHSERRQYFGETEETLVPKLRAARAQGLLPMLCVGETLAQRDGGSTLDVLRRQLAILAEAGPDRLALAYEPVPGHRHRPPGRGQPDRGGAQLHPAAAGQPAGRTRQADAHPRMAAACTPDNFAEILGIPEVAGGLVGGASLEAGKFLKLVAQAQATV